MRSYLALLLLVSVSLGQRSFRGNTRFVSNGNTRFVNNNNNNNRFSSNNNRFSSSSNNGFSSSNNANARFGGGASNNNNNNVLNGANFVATPSGSRDRDGTEVYPGCNGTVCLPEANLCSKRQRKGGHFRHGGKSYWFSWASDENALRNARWNWFTGRNYCRKMCMDMVSFETAEEENFVTNLMRQANIKDIHTVGRLCDKEVEGCDQARFQPLNINGWFWASTLRMMPPTNLRGGGKYNNWAAGQPDGSLRADGFGNEACMALADKNTGSGYKWYDEACGTRRILACEDLPEPNINFVRNQNPNIRIP